MRLRLGGLAVVAVLALGACGSDGEAADPAARRGGPADVDLELASARDTLPPAPSVADGLTVVLTHPGGAGDPGLDAAAGALAQRPDLRVVIAVADGTGDVTMSGFPVAVTGQTAADAVGAALDADPEADLVVVGIADGHGIGGTSAEASVAEARDVPALVVGSGPGPQPDLAAATMQLLDVVDLELDALLDGGARRLAVPSCEHGMLRGRLTARATRTAPPELRSDCTSTVVPGRDEAEAFAHGYATLTPLG
ncbi:MAG TPA: hypothetical protein VFV42_08035 [Acidimicrobiales bacterium]|nr:hypothetical protein [Acidimicrobiales bacterium]